MYILINNVPYSVQNGIQGPRDSMSIFPPFPLNIQQFSEVELVIIAYCSVFWLLFALFFCPHACFRVISSMQHAPSLIFTTQILLSKSQVKWHPPSLHLESSESLLISSFSELPRGFYWNVIYVRVLFPSATKWGWLWTVTVPVSQGAIVPSSGMLTGASDFPLRSHCYHSQARSF